MTQPRVTGLVLTYNGAYLLEECLKSLDFCDELLVVDSNSRDNSREIAESCGARVLVRAWDGPAAQFAYAFSQITTEWVVSLDQDEMLCPRLRQSIMSALGRDPHSAGQPEQSRTNAYLCNRSSFYFDHFMRHSGWYPDRLPRVFRLAATQVHVSGAHYGFKVEGWAPLLDGDIVHHPYRDIGEQDRKSVV